MRDYLAFIIFIVLAAAGAALYLLDEPISLLPRRVGYVVPRAPKRKLARSNESERLRGRCSSRLASLRQLLCVNPARPAASGYSYYCSQSSCSDLAQSLRSQRPRNRRHISAHP